MPVPRIIIIGTGDTKSEEILYMRTRIEEAGGRAILLDVSVLGAPTYAPDYDKHAVAAAAGTTIDAIAKSGDENTAMTLMARGTATLVRELHATGKLDAFIALGGTMGTDLALEVAQALPLGVPKFIVSTVAYSHLVPPDRIAPDLMMILWSGGLYGLNGACRSVLSQACGAVVGAAKLASPPTGQRPVVAMSSLGKSCLSYMLTLKPALEARGYEVAVFHTTGMGGRALEALAAQKHFVAVMDFSLQEITNSLSGSFVGSGPDRLENAGRAGIPQIVAPGAVDLVDFAAWREPPAGLETRPYHAHNRLLASVTVPAEQRREVARVIGEKLAQARGPVAFILPTGGIQAWDRPGEPLHEPEALAAFLDAMRAALPTSVAMHEIEDHINSQAFVDEALAIFDAWVAEGIIPAGQVELGALI